MSAMQRTKGRAFEQKIARMLRERLPHATIRRGRQSHRADEPDVVIEGAGDPWDSLWLELQDARCPTPEAKLEQAREDAAGRGGRVPVAITHRIHERRSFATLKYADLYVLLHGEAGRDCWYRTESVALLCANVTMDAEHFFDALSAAHSFSPVLP